MRKQRETKPGDVLELRVEERFAYMHYIGRILLYGDMLLIRPGFQDQQASPSAKLFEGAYVAFYPVTLTIKRGLVSVVGHLPPPPLPTQFRRRALRTDHWILEKDGRYVTKQLLSDEEKKLPISENWPHATLVERIAEEWTPQTDVPVSPPVGAAKTIPSAADNQRSISHYLYFPSRKEASEVATELIRRGFQIEQRLGSDGLNWLVLATHEIIPDENFMVGVRDDLEALAAKFGGEYDGWEAAVGDDGRKSH